MDWGQLREGGALIGVGMAMVFAALLVLMVAIMVVNRLAPERARKAEGPTVLEGLAAEESEKRRVAAMAVALARAMEAASRGRARAAAGVPEWADGPSPWVRAGREEVMRSRGKAGRQWGRRSG